MGQGGQVFHRQHLRAARSVDMRAHPLPRGQLAPDHRLYEPGPVDLRARRTQHLGAVPQDRDPVADGEHLVQPVADEAQRVAVGAQAPHHLEQRPGLFASERGGRLVEVDHYTAVDQGPSALDELLLGDAQLLRFHLGVYVQAHPVEVRRRLPLHGPPVDVEPQPAPPEDADKKVLGDGQRLHQRRLLGHQVDPPVLRRAGAQPHQAVPAEQKFS